MIHGYIQLCDLGKSFSIWKTRYLYRKGTIMPALGVAMRFRWDDVCKEHSLVSGMASPAMRLTIFCV